MKTVLIFLLVYCFTVVLNGAEVRLDTLWEGGGLPISGDSEMTLLLKSVEKATPDLFQRPLTMFSISDDPDSEKSLSVFSVHRIIVNNVTLYVAVTLPGKYDNVDLKGAMKTFTKRVIKRASEINLTIEGDFIEGNLGCYPIVLKANEHGGFDDVSNSSFGAVFVALFGKGMPVEIQNIQNIIPALKGLDFEVKKGK